MNIHAAGAGALPRSGQPFPESTPPERGYLKGEKHRQQVFIKHELIDTKEIDAKLPKQ